MRKGRGERQCIHEFNEYTYKLCIKDMLPEGRDMFEVMIKTHGAEMKRE